ncbi:hypothetical protein SBRCBS47491_006651 [Sporothrix bragantina]|uniref:Uncharacterized protein n=1 Tax=Sporothrix bragantina TaxID=671064 RepID=A0ABP0C6P0_9PEZI
MASVAGKATGNPNPTSAQYAAQRGSIDMLMRPREGKAPTSSSGGGDKTSKSDSGGQAASQPKMSFMEAIRAQRQVRVQQLRDMPRSRTAPGSVLMAASAASNEAPSNFHKGSGGGGFSALASSSSKIQKTKAKAKPQGNNSTAWVAALSGPLPSTETTTTTVTTRTTTPAASTSTSAASFAQVQDELEAGFQKYSRANPLGGVGSGHSGEAEGGAQNSGQGERQGSNQSQNQQGASMPPTTATSRNLKARQLMMAPRSAAARREEEMAAHAKKKQYNNGGDDSSDEDVGRSALGRKKARKG